MNDQKHVLWENGEDGAPDCIKDRNGEVVLGLCKVCGKGESELVEECEAEQEKPQ